eukprot:GABV01011925.1.p1 GENE.GABV01011925.1~~GABV01011925.1.p1  ORF type:complete len:105 (+),score=36.83 GABV01011925.1:102-416(+)
MDRFPLDPPAQEEKLPDLPMVLALSTDFLEYFEGLTIHEFGYLFWQRDITRRSFDEPPQVSTSTWFPVFGVLAGQELKFYTSHEEDPDDPVGMTYLTTAGGKPH